MSGGSYDYLCYKMQEAARTLIRKDQVAYRKAFGNLMMRCANAMHDIEWVDSSDMGQGDDEKSIMECIKFSDVLGVTVEESEIVAHELDRLIRLTKEQK